MILKKQTLIKTILLLIITMLLFINCERDDFTNNDNEDKVSYTIKKITLENFSTKEDIGKILKSIKQNNNSYKKKHSKNAKNVYANDSSFVILTDNILEATDSTATNYTFKIKRPEIDTLSFENLVISKKNNEVNYFIIKYMRDSINLEFKNYTQNITVINENLINVNELQNNGYTGKLVFEECAVFVYERCGFGGNADGHASVFWQGHWCGGSPLIVADYSGCNGSGGGGGDGSYGYGGSPQGVVGVIGDSTNNNINVRNAIDNFFDSLSIPEREAITIENYVALSDFLQNNANLDIIPTNIIDFANQAVQAISEGSNLDFTVLLPFLTTNGGLINLNATPTDTLNFNNASDFIDHINDFNNSFVIDNLEVAPGQNGTKVTKFKGKFNLVIPLYINAHITSILDNSDTTNINEFEIVEVNSFESGITPFIEWTQDSHEHSQTNHLTSVTINGHFTIGIKIGGNILTYTDSWIIIVVYNNQTGEAVTLNVIKGN